MARRFLAAVCTCAALLPFTSPRDAVSADYYGGPTTARCTDLPSAVAPSGEIPETTGDTGPAIGLTEQFAAFSGGTTVQSFSGTYIDNAIVGDQLRFRFDAAYNNPLPDRAEYFYAKCGCFQTRDADGPPLPETSVDYQEYMGYVEMAISPRFSGFVEVPFRAINPEVNDNTSGLSDIRTGFKYALLADCNRWLTFQFKVYTPTGDADQGLGTSHVSLEPGLLYYNQLTNRFSLFGEFRNWIPLSDAEFQGENFDGTILQYGLGTGYDLWQGCDPCGGQRRFTLVNEFVGWTILDGLASDGQGRVLDVSGDTIVNAKVSGRYTSGPHSVSVGYGIPVTGDEWYSDIVRLEYRIAY